MQKGASTVLSLPIARAALLPLAPVMSHWCRLRRAGPVRRRDLDPAAFAGLLSNVALIQRLRGPPPHLLVRLAGEEIANRDIGFTKGRLVEQVIPPWYGRHLAETYEAAIAAAVPVLQSVRATGEFRDHRYHRLLLPLWEGGEEAESLLVATQTEDDSELESFAA